MEAHRLRLARRVRDLFVDKEMTLALAESCTGGLIAATLTSIPEASKYFHSAIVSYSLDAKSKFLNLDMTLPEGIVSDETARAMAEGALRATGADAALATTGNAGPGTLEGKPVGMIFIAMALKEITSTRMLTLKGDRQNIIEKAAIHALEFLLQEISDLPMQHGIRK